MSKGLSAASLLLSAGAVAGVVFASGQLTKMSGEFERIEGRLAAMEKPAAVSDSAVRKHPGDSAEGGGDAPGAAGKVETLPDAIRELKRLREEVASMQERTAAPVSNPDGTSPAVAGTPSAEDPVLRKAVEDVLAAKDKERAEADKKRQAEFMKARTERTVADLTEKLGLSAQQKDQVAVILTASSNQQMEIWSNRKEGDNPWPKVQELRKETDGQVKQLLTAEQQTKYDEYMKANDRPRMIQVEGGGTPGGGGSFGGGPGR